MTKVCWLRLCIHHCVTLNLSSALRPSALTLGREGSHFSFLINLTGCSGHHTFLTRLHLVEMHSYFPWHTTDVLLKPSHTSDDLESLLKRKFWFRRSGVRLRFSISKRPRGEARAAGLWTMLWGVRVSCAILEPPSRLNCSHLYRGCDFKPWVPF